MKRFTSPPVETDPKGNMNRLQRMGSTTAVAAGKASASTEPGRNRSPESIERKPLSEPSSINESAALDFFNVSRSSSPDLPISVQKRLDKRLRTSAMSATANGSPAIPTSVIVSGSQRFIGSGRHHFTRSLELSPSSGLELGNSNTHAGGKPDIAEQDSEDEGGEIRTASRGRKKLKSFDGILIGHHKDEPSIRIFGKEDAHERMLYRAYLTDDLADDVCANWDQLVSVNHLVHNEKVILNKDIFDLDDATASALTKVEKNKLVKKYLRSRVPSMQASSFQPKNLQSNTPVQKELHSYDPSLLLVGSLKGDIPVPVHAFVRRRASNNGTFLMFKCLPEDTNQCGVRFPRQGVKDLDTIKFLPEFAGDDIAETKAAILSRFTPKSNEDNIEALGSVPTRRPIKRDADAMEGYLPGTVIVPERAQMRGDDLQSDAVPRLPATLENARLARTVADAEYEQQMLCYHRTVHNEKSELEGTRDSLKRKDLELSRKLDAITKLDKRSEERKKALDTREAILDKHDDLIKWEQQLKNNQEEWNGEKQKQEASLRERREEVEATAKEAEGKLEKAQKLKKEVTELQASIPKREEKIKTEGGTPIACSYPATFPRAPSQAQVPNAPQAPTLSIIAPIALQLDGNDFDANYHKIPAGRPYAGFWFRSRAGPERTIQGKKFRETRFLYEITDEPVVHDCKLAVEGVRLPEPCTAGEYEFVRYMKDGMEKLVQKLGAKSLVHHQGRFFISWVVLKQIDTIDYSI